MYKYNYVLILYMYVMFLKFLFSSTGMTSRKFVQVRLQVCIFFYSQFYEGIYVIVS